MSTTTRRLGRIHLVTIPTRDPDRSIAFYESLGFDKRADAPFGDGHRWVELFPPDGTAGIALAPAADGAPGVETGIIIVSDDVDATHAELRAAGADVDEQVAREGSPAEVSIRAADLVEPFPPMFRLRDPDGNVLLIIG